MVLHWDIRKIEFRIELALNILMPWTGLKETSGILEKYIRPIHC